MARIFLSIGSNIEPATYLKQCAVALESQFTRPCWSPVYRSAAVGMIGDDFLNAVVVAHTNQSIESTNQTLRQIENNHGRVRSANKFTSRTLDIDLLLYDDIVTSTPDVTLPRPEITSALHVLMPLVNLAPLEVHTPSGKTYRTLLHELELQQPADMDQPTIVELEL